MASALHAPKPPTEYVLLDRDIRALRYVERVFGSGPPFGSTPDPLALMNDLTRWPDPPAMDQRWEQKLAAACEIAVAYAKLAHSYKVQAERNRLTR